MYTFDFCNNFVHHHYLLSDENGVIDSYDVRSKKLRKLKLTDNPTYPELSAF